MPAGSTEPEAILVVFSEPGEAVELKEFNGEPLEHFPSGSCKVSHVLVPEWYDEEHVPLRMSRFPEFVTGTRYEAIDNCRPAFAAIYGVSSLGLFDEPRYRSLRTNRSGREAELFTRIGTIDRRTYRAIHVERRPSSPHNSSYLPHILTVELSKLSPELCSEIQSLDVWVKTLVGQIVDSSVVGQLQPPSTDSIRGPPYILIFEFMNQDYECSSQLAKLANTPQPNQIVIRKWKLYRGWHNSA